MKRNADIETKWVVYVRHDNRPIKPITEARSRRLGKSEINHDDTKNGSLIAVLSSVMATVRGRMFAGLD